MDNIKKFAENSSVNLYNFEEWKKAWETENSEEVAENLDQKAKDFTKQCADKVRDFIYPLYKKVNVANKWSFDVAYFMNTSIRSLNEDYDDYDDYDEDYTEFHLIENITPKTYLRKIKDIIYNSIVLMGKIYLQYEVGYSEINRLLFQIENEFNCLDNMRSYLDSWLYYEPEWTNSRDFVDLCDVIAEAEEKFSALYDYYKNKDVAFGYIDSNHISGYAVSEISKTRLIYNKLLKFHSKVINLDYGDVTYPYWEEFQKFGKNLYDKLIYSTGMAYMDITGRYNIEDKERNTIIRCFERLERKYVRNQSRLDYMLEELKREPAYGSQKDRVLLEAYEELKETVKNTIFSSWN